MPEPTNSWLPGADESGFGLANLPWGVIRRGEEPPRPAVRIGDHAVELHRLAQAGLLDDTGVDASAFDAPTLNAFIECGSGAWSSVRARLTELLSVDGPLPAEQIKQFLVPLDKAETVMPVAIGDYVDGYASIEHASNVGRMFRPDGDPLMPNWRHLPVAYHGRAGTVVVSGTPITRPCGQRAPEQPGGSPTFGPERRLDIELELGAVCGPGPAEGPIDVRSAAQHIFGVVLLNDWSAREIQRWEYQPLGPFLGKSFATSISPWIVPLDAIDALRVNNVEQDPPPLPYLEGADRWALDIELEVALTPAGAEEETIISATNARGQYWTIPQQLAHATVNGATVRAGDLFGTGTISGPEPGTFGSLLELSWGGSRPITLPDGTTRSFLEDGDTVVLRGRGDRGSSSISFGEVAARIDPARVPVAVGANPAQAS
jgi:fumarylacetoacetase